MKGVIICKGSSFVEIRATAVPVGTAGTGNPMFGKSDLAKFEANNAGHF